MSQIPPPVAIDSVAETALRVLERVTDPFYALDAQWRIVYANPPAEASFGRRLDEVRGRVLWEAFPGANVAPFRAEIERVAREQRPSRFEARSPALGRWFEVRCHPCLDGVAVYLRDIDDRRRAEQALRERSNAFEASERHLGMLLGSIGDHLVSFDPQWRYTYVNDGAARMLGRTKEELLGRSIWELFPEAVGNQYWRELHEVAREQKPLHSEHYYEPWDRWYENRIYPSPDGVTVFATDISARKRIEQALADRERSLIEADRRKDEFLAMLAHELRNPLAPIRQAAHLAGMPQATPAQVRWSHEVVARQVQHMSRLLDDLLDMSRISRGTIHLRRSPVRIGTVVETAIETARPVLEARRHAFEIELGANDLVVLADANRLAQVVSNLLSNAAKYTDPGGRIRLLTGREGETLCVRVVDDGVGIAPEHLDRVFDMFTQVPSAVDRSEGGLGIGLALVKGIVELHGGTVTAHSEGVGRGSEFTVRLPLPSAWVAPEAGGGDPQAERGRPLRVLVADDNVDAAETLGLLLRLEGHEVRTAGDGLQALSAAREFAPDVALLDIGMPGMNGYQLAMALRADEATRGIRLIALTGWGNEQDKQQSSAAGFDAHLTKPVEPEALNRLLRG